MQWFVVGWMVTVLWGNGGVEEARTDWSDVYFGTLAQCQAFATELRVSQEKSAERLKDDSVFRTGSHANYPAKWNGGIRDFHVDTAFCAPFASPDAIKVAFPMGWDGFGGSRDAKDGGFEAFRWWDGPNGATMH